MGKVNIAKLRGLTYADYGISVFRYKELRYFCMQYREKKDNIQYGISAVLADGMPHTRTVGSPTEKSSIRNVDFQRDVELIETAVRQVDELVGVMLSPYLLRSVTEDLSYDYVAYDANAGTIPVGKTDFYACRRLFYGVLHMQTQRASWEYKKQVEVIE